MHSNSPAPFSRLAILITTLCILATVIGFSFYALKSGSSEVYKYLIPILLIVSIIGMKFAAPRLPWGQVALAGAVVFMVHFLIEHLSLQFPPMLFVGELIIQAICTIGFGRYWVANSYIPASSNTWPE